MRPWQIPGNVGQGAINGAPTKVSGAVGGAFMRPWQIPGNVGQGAINGAPTRDSGVVGGAFMRPWQIPGNVGQGAINGAPTKGSCAPGKPVKFAAYWAVGLTMALPDLCCARYCC